MPTRTLVLAVLLLLAGVTAATAQERQVPLDERGRVEVIDARMAQRLGLWVEQYPGFREARLFQAADGRFVLEITTMQGGQLARERIPMTAEEVAALRARLTGGMAATPMSRPGGQEGRYLLLGQTTLAGVAFYGPAVPQILDAEGSAIGGLYLLTAAASFFLPFVLTNEQPVTFGMANLSRYGVTRGGAHGALLYNLVAGERRDREVCLPEGCYVEHDDGWPDDDRGRLASAMAVSIGEGVGGYLWARNSDMTPGTANTIVTFGDAGLLWGLGAAHVVGLEGDGRGAAALGLAGAAAGVVGGRALAARRDYTWGDADMLYTAGALGGYSALALAVAVDADEDRPVTAAVMLGSAGGLLLADRLVQQTDFTVGQAVLNRLGTIAGGLAGAAPGVMMEEEKVALVGSAAGAIAGYLLTYSALAAEARENRGDRMSRWRIDVHPQGVLGLAGATSTSTGPLPMLNVRYSFGGGSAGVR